MKNAILTLALLCISLVGSAQMADNSVQHPLLDTTTDLAAKMYYYSLQKPATTLFVHFDKTVYTNNENVWFSGYVIRGNINNPYNTLSVALLNNADSSVAIEEKFLMVNGLSYGNILLPDSLPPGNYSLIAYTNQLVNGAPEDVFMQPVTIKTVKEPGFLATVKVVDSLRHPDDTIKVLLKASTKDFRLVKEAEVTYTVGKGKQIVASGKSKTNLWGECNIAIPASKLNATNNLLQVQVKADKEIKKLRLQLPVFDTLPLVKFYPEGGNIIEQLPSVIGFEVTTASGDPLPATALLYEDGTVKDTMQTDAFGMGHFKLTALIGKKYAVKLLSKVGIGKPYSLPAALPDGPVIHIKNALAGDSLSVRLRTKHAGMYHLLLHNYKQVYQVFDLQVLQSVSKDLTFPLSEVPKGVVAVTLVDSVGTPWAERMIFAHYNQRTVVQVTTDSTAYGTRKKVQLSFTLAGDTAVAKKALISIACVQENRLEMRKTQDIESYFYLKHDLAAMPYLYRPLNNDTLLLGYLQNVLLIKGWRRYTWKGMLQAKPGDTLLHRTSLELTGLVRKNEKPIKKPVTIAMVQNNGIRIFPTDSLGGFVLENDSIVMPQGKKALLTIAMSSGRKMDYGIEITDPYKTLNKKLAAENAAAWEEPKVPVQDTRLTLIPANEKARTLETVIVTSSKTDNSLYGARRNACGDYVCLYNILNCPNHTNGGTPPVQGKVYRDPSGGSVVYSGCNEVKQENTVAVKGIYTFQEFYGSDYAVANPAEPEYISTIFWKHEAMLTPGKETTFSFYTSDIEGRFKVIAQGITGSGVVYGEQIFTVKKTD